VTFNELNLSKALLNAIEDLGYTNPSPIQYQAFPIIMSGKDLVGIAQTGTGKTFAYLLPILRLFKYDKKKEPKVLILVPTRELVVQITSEILKLTEYMNCSAIGVFGGVNMNTQKINLSTGCDILVGTPGRTMDLMLCGSVKPRLLKKLIIDEFDEMLHLGFKHQLNTILDLLPSKRQNLLFSATNSKEVSTLINEYFDKPQVLEITRSGTPLLNIKQTGYAAENFLTKKNLLVHLLNKEEYHKVLVFVGTKSRADILYPYIKDEFRDKVGIIHSNKSQNYRIKTVESFENKTIQFLISTDLVARGIDITDITHVINFDLPEEAVTYMHRMGRTGRADKSGESITFIRIEDEEIKSEIETMMNKGIEILNWPTEVKIEEKLIEDELVKHKPGDKHYMKEHTLKDSQGAYHEKSEKNKKVNLGGSYRRKVKAKYKKPIRRSGKGK